MNCFEKAITGPKDGDVGGTDEIEKDNGFIGGSDEIGGAGFTVS
jgi:hypothetical protein